MWYGYFKELLDHCLSKRSYQSPLLQWKHLNHEHLTFFGTFLHVHGSSVLTASLFHTLKRSEIDPCLQMILKWHSFLTGIMWSPHQYLLQCSEVKMAAWQLWGSEKGCGRRSVSVWNCRLMADLGTECLYNIPLISLVYHFKKPCSMLEEHKKRL